MDGHLGLDIATRAKAVRALARLRMDREGGAGTYDQMIRSIAENGSAAAILHASLEKVYERAERNMGDVLACIAEARKG